MKGALKKRSKRISTRTRVKQEKKLREHNAKVRREKRKDPKKFSKRSKKDPGIPSSCPFKEDVLKEVEAARLKKLEVKEKRRLEATKRRQEARDQLLHDKRTKGLEGLVAEAEMKRNSHEEAMQMDEESGVDIRGGGAKGGDQSAKAYYKEFTKVVEAADVILEVLDARDPNGTRCREVEEAVLNQSSSVKAKRLVLVLNKADLVPKENLEAWLRHLRRQLPTVPFKASTQSQGSRLGRSQLSVEQSSRAQMQTSKCVGASALTALLANYGRIKDARTSVRVGVVGLPNVGKSSLINSLKRSRACGVGAVPGVTRTAREVQIDSRVRLLDSPGMVLASSGDSGSVALRNALKVDSLADPVKPVEAILQRCPKQQMMLQYGIPDYESGQEFLGLVARSVGRLKKGGLPDQEAAARMVLNDWNSGKIKYYTHPPPADDGDHDSGKDTKDQGSASSSESAIVSEYSKEFNLDDFDKMESDDFQNLPQVLPSQTMLVDSSGIVEKAATIDDEDDDDEEEEDLEECGSNDDSQGIPKECGNGLLSKDISISKEGFQEKRERKAKKATSKDSDDKIPAAFQSGGLLRLKKLDKVRQKKELKDRRRRDRVASDLSRGLEVAFSTI